MKTKGEQKGAAWQDIEPEPNERRLTRGNIGQGITDSYITEGLSIERRKFGIKLHVIGPERFEGEAVELDFPQAFLRLAKISLDIAAK